ncbi:SGNH/GDSL hydrolase family protein [Actinacidiphila sp. bgisy144]|uniref:SGNH/GDSL hydrolase family protein n=1 Tax=Actinacidiphila sp. bgisy144 TaxID=3413791 RepID=UPI003EC070C3
MPADITLPFEKGSHVLFIGDSITDAGRTKDRAPYGGGYVSLIQALVTAQAPELALRWTNRGVSGDTVRDLAGRWQADVLAERPDWLFVKIGINDCWRGIEGKADEAVSVEEYRTTLSGLLDRAIAETGCRLVLATPYLIEGDTSDPWRTESDRYVAAAREVAAEKGLPLIDVQAAFDRVLAHTAPADWAGDRVHPVLAGHAVIARAFLAVIGELGAAGTA